jgi:hypothetical protein
MLTDPAFSRYQRGWPAVRRNHVRLSLIEQILATIVAAAADLQRTVVIPYAALQAHVR